MNNFIANGIGVIAVAMLALGCGSSDAGTNASAQVTKADFVKQLGKVCAKAKSELAPKAREWEATHGHKAIGWNSDLKQILGPQLKQEAEDLKRLPAPEQLQAEMTRMIANLLDGANSFITEGTKANAKGFKLFQNEAEALGAKACNI